MIPSKFRVMTVYLGLDDAADAGHPWQVRLPAIVKLVESYQPAVLSVQQGSQARIEALAAALPALKLVHEHRRWVEDAPYTAVLFNPEEVELEDARDIWLSETPRVRGSSSWGASMPAVATLAELRHRASKRRLLFAAAHLEPQVEKARFQQAGTLLSQLLKGNSDKLPIVLAGSFHEGVDGSVYKLLTGRRVLNGVTGGFQDAWRRLGRPDAGADTDLGYGELKGGRTDWIMFDAGLELQDVTRFAEPVEGEWPSSHAAVGAELLV